MLADRSPYRWFSSAWGDQVLNGAPTNFIAGNNHHSTRLWWQGKWWWCRWTDLWWLSELELKRASARPRFLETGIPKQHLLSGFPGLWRKPRLWGVFKNGEKSTKEDKFGFKEEKRRLYDLAKTIIHIWTLWRIFYSTNHLLTRQADSSNVRIGESTNYINTYFPLYPSSSMTLA